MHAIQRETFATSRLMDFFSRKELEAQTGHPQHEWPIVAVKELIDNAIDACEDAGMTPEIGVTIDDAEITVTDNGPGLPTKTVEGILDYSVRVSSREAYISPTRGAQGNALKTLVAMPFCLDGDLGLTEIESRGIHHAIRCRVDRIRQEPTIEHEQSGSLVKNGTCLKLHWPNLASSILGNASSEILQILSGFALTNPHLTLTATLWGDSFEWKATDPAWSKWKPSDPTSPHWYTVESMMRLVAAYIALDAERGTTRTLREFISQFKGLTSTGKQKAALDALGYSRQPLTILARDGDIDRPMVERLLEAMKAHAAPVKPKHLGMIGKPHLETRFLEFGCTPETFNYDKQMGERDGIPYAIETAFGYMDNDKSGRQLVTGVNWSPGIVNPFRRLGKYGESMDSVLQELRAGLNEPIILLLHLACARVNYTDRGKSSIALEG